MKYMEQVNNAAIAGVVVDTNALVPSAKHVVSLSTVMSLL